MPEGLYGMGDRREGKPPARITWGEKPLHGGEPNSSIWIGTITARIEVLKKRFFGREDIADEQVAQLLDELKEKVNDYYVKADTKAPVRCIDGRNENEEADDQPSLGPQVSGGTPSSVISYRLALWEKLHPGVTIESDLEEVRHLLEQLNMPFPPGAHEDEHNEHSDEKTGCGAIDKMLEIVQLMGNRDITAMRNYTQAIAGEYWDEQIFESIQDKLEIMNGAAFNKRYFMRGDDGKPKHGNRLIKKVKSFAKGGKSTVEKLKGEHNEVFLLINKRHGETFNRDKFALDHENKAQAFNYDVWHTIERAQTLFAGNDEAQKTVIISNIMYAIATGMALTDGSLEYGIRE